MKIQHFEGSTLRAIHFQGSKLARLNDGFIGKGMHFEGNTLREVLLNLHQESQNRLKPE